MSDGFVLSKMDKRKGKKERKRFSLSCLKYNKDVKNNYYCAIVNVYK